MDLHLGVTVVPADVIVNTEEHPEYAGEEIQFPAVELVLSERNLKSLLLNIGAENNVITRLIPEAGAILILRAEHNDVHYKDRAAGLMDESTELQLAAEELGSDQTLYIPEDFGEPQD